MAILQAGQEPLVDLEKFLAPFGQFLRRSESRESLERYTTGLLSGTSRKTASELGRSLPAINGQRLQEFLTRTDWDPEKMDQLRAEHMRSHACVGNGVLILDDTGFAKKGTGSVGVARQYSGTLGRVDNCQVLVTAHYVDRVFDWPVTARLYLPESWTKDDERRKKAHVPKSVLFKTKGGIGLDLVKWSIQAKVSFGAVVIDAGYGDQPVLLDGLVALEIPHIAAVSSTSRFRYAKSVDEDQGDPPPPPYSGRGKPKKAPALQERIPAVEAEHIVAQLPLDAWQRVAWRRGTRGPLVKEFARVEVFRSGYRGAHLPVRGWLLGERPISKSVRKEDLKYYFAWKLGALSLEELVELAHIRWVIERFYQDAKGELGLDHYEGRLWTGFHRHVALVMLAHCYLTLRQSYGADTIEQRPPGRGQSQSAPPLALGRGFPPGGKKKHGRATQGGS
ncbi:MAG: IS701 family transposase [Syntrophobacteraceae bacterium]